MILIVNGEKGVFEMNLLVAPVGTTEFIVELVLSIIISLVVVGILVVLFKRKRIWILSCCLLVAINLCYFFAQMLPFYILSGILVVFIIMASFINLSSIRNFLANPLHSMSSGTGTESNLPKIDYDSNQFSAAITKTVKWLSDNRTGAIITFERGTNLDKYISSGTIINCPFTPEIVETIFYEGTRLHDGALIIRNNIIVAASVFYPSTNKTLVGKYGARHRAAIGISEVSDAVTIIVSEETGRIAIAYAGVLEQVKYDEFEKVFHTFMVAPSGTVTSNSAVVDKNHRNE